MSSWLKSVSQQVLSGSGGAVVMVCNCLQANRAQITATYGSVRCHAWSGWWVCRSWGPPSSCNGFFHMESPHHAPIGAEKRNLHTKLCLLTRLCVKIISPHFEILFKRKRYKAGAVIQQIQWSRPWHITIYSRWLQSQRRSFPHQSPPEPCFLVRSSKLPTNWTHSGSPSSKFL